MSESGKVKGANNVKSFDEFVKLRNQLSDWHRYINSSRKKLIRTLICKECSFGKSAFIQNPLLKEKFRRLELDLQQKDILLTNDSKQSSFQYLKQEVFIKDYECKISQYKISAIKIEKLITLYLEEIEQLD